MQRKTILILAAAAVIVALGIFFWVRYQNAPAQYDAFAQCLKDKGAVFYGAFWCPHCQNQKKMFARSARLLPYVECSTPDGHGQLPVCNEKQVTGYPTWVFPDASRLTGEIPLPTLAEKTGCALPSAK